MVEGDRTLVFAREVDWSQCLSRMRPGSGMSGVKWELELRGHLWPPVEDRGWVSLV